MDETLANARTRPLARSLDPLAGESLGGYLLRLAYRLHLTPIRLAHLTGCATGPTTTRISRRLLLGLDINGFAQATRLTRNEALALTLIPWADRYPPIARSQSGAGRSASTDDWLFNNSPRYCPQCLAGDGSPIQQQYGGPWKKIWHLPIAFICPDHRVFLQHGCLSGHPLERDISRLITQTADSTLHPAQCRQPRPDYPAARGRKGPSCGARLDQPWDPGPFRPSLSTLETQQRLLDLLDPCHPAKDAVRNFADLRVITALLCASWPLGRDLIDPSMIPAVTEHIDGLGAGVRRALDTPPKDATATAALLTAAAALLATTDLQGTLAQHLQATSAGHLSKAPWARILSRHESSCSEVLRQAAEPATRAYRRTRPHGTKAPARTNGYRPEHIPAFLEQNWYQQHLAPLECGSCYKTMRRTAAVLLVQWAAGGSMGDAADFLGINNTRSQYAPSSGFYQWLGDHGQARFTAALQDLARDLDTASGLIDYLQRREALRGWSLAPDAWQELISRLPPVPGPVQPNLDDRKRQEASAFVWAYVTRGEPRFAPRPIEAKQPEQLRRAWRLGRSTTWFQLSRSDPLNHYSALRKLLILHADRLAREIDATPSCKWRLGED
ncbi:TniQ family protein [Streptosporangium subroseum]|uniref:TniQ family protein n=1 Tax=Streptosporangium subroseum TaxID=106412 RepID=UPI0034247337